LGDKVDGIGIWIFDLKTLLPEQRTANAHFGADK
jgi:hypothetical protein